MTPSTQLQTPAEPGEIKAPARVCPHCGNEQVRESTTRRGVDLLPSNIGRSPYRCRGCRGRFYVKAEGETRVKAALKSATRKPRRERDPFFERPNVKRHMGELSVAGGSIVAFAIFLYLLSRSGTGF